MPGLRTEARRAPSGCRYRAVPGSTSTTCAGSTGNEDACVVVIIVCPMPAIRSASTLRRPGSSSESTSSKSSSGAGSSSCASASSSERTARRCSPCEPNWRRSRSPLAIATSSRCGPIPVVPRSMSRAEPRLELGGGRWRRPCTRAARRAARAHPRAPRSSGASCLERHPARRPRARPRAPPFARSTARAPRGPRARAARDGARRFAGQGSRGSPAGSTLGREAAAQRRGRSTRAGPQVPL